MSRILLDQNIPAGLRRLLPAHDVQTAFRMGWPALENGALLAAADAAGFDALISGDQSLAYQQSLAGRRIAVLILSTNPWPVVRLHGPAIERAVYSLAAGRFARLIL